VPGTPASAKAGERARTLAPLLYSAAMSKGPAAAGRPVLLPVAHKRGYAVASPQEGLRSS